MHHRPPVNDRAWRLQILPYAFAQFFQRVKHDVVGVGIFALRKVDSVEAVKELEQLLIDFTKCQRAIDAQLRGGSFLPRRRPNQISAVRSRTRLNNTLWLCVSSLLINTSSASGSLKPVKYQKSLLCR
jgi:hypothetical protein